MGVAPSDFMGSAQVMLAAGAEIDLRNAVSRSYYAVYHRALSVAELACPDGNSHLRMGSHQRLIERFRGSGLPRGRNIAYIMQNLKVMRHKADYEPDSFIARSSVDTHIKMAEALLVELDGIPVGNP